MIVYADYEVGVMRSWEKLPHKKNYLTNPAINPTHNLGTLCTREHTHTHTHTHTRTHTHTLTNTSRG